MKLSLFSEFSMEYNGELVRHYFRNYWYETSTKLDGCSTKFDELGTKYNPEVIKN